MLQLQVILKDVGRTEVVSPSAIRKLAPVFTSVRDGSIKCHLTNVKAAGDNSTWSSMACEELNDIIKKHRSNLYISKKVTIVFSILFFTSCFTKWLCIKYGLFSFILYLGANI